MIHFLPSASAESNAYVVEGEIACVIDAGIGLARFTEHEREYDIRITSLINTHCHFDHVGANQELMKRDNMHSYCHELDADALVKGDTQRQLAHLFGKPPVRHEVTRQLTQGNRVDLGGTALEVLHTPGHTPGGICLFEEDSGTLFTGDTVFAEGVGRTDFAGGSFEDLKASIEKLVEFTNEHDVKKVCPGHGPEAGPECILKAYEDYF